MIITVKTDGVSSKRWTSAQLIDGDAPDGIYLQDDGSNDAAIVSDDGPTIFIEDGTNTFETLHIRNWGFVAAPPGTTITITA